MNDTITDEFFSEEPTDDAADSSASNDSSSIAEIVVADSAVADDSPSGDSDDDPFAEGRAVSEGRAVYSEDEKPESAIARPFALNSFSKPIKFKEEAEDKVELSEEELFEKTALYPWYVVHTYSGFEARVKLSLEERIRNAKLQEKFGRIIVPQEQVVELVRGEKKTSSRKFFPGYILIQCDLTDESWHLVANTPKVTGFVGDTRHPVPLSPQEVQNLFDQMEGGAKKPRPKVQFEDGDSVKVVDGPFADFNGVVDEVKPDKGKLRVLISIFGRNTPVELDFVQVEKV